MKSERKLDADHVPSPTATSVTDSCLTANVSRSLRTKRVLKVTLLTTVGIAIACFFTVVVLFFPDTERTTTVLSTSPDGFRIEHTFFDAGAVRCRTRIELVDPTGRDRATLFDRTGMYGIQVEFQERRIVLMNSPPQEESRRIVRCSGEAFEVIEK